MIIQASAEEVLTISREQLGISASAAIDDTLLAAMLRRAAGVYCPCSLSTLIAAVVESLSYLTDGGIELQERVAAAAEGLIVVGDLLELNQVTLDDPNAKGTWFFCAPPGFIVRPSGSIFLIGIVPDESTPLPTSLSSRVQYETLARILVPTEGENLPLVLRDFGLRDIPASTWLKSPKTKSPAQLRDDMVRRLREQPPSGSIADLSILFPDRPIDYYSRRWTAPRDNTGEFVARRPQAYGAPLWGFAHLERGDVTQFLDFPLMGTQGRGCDAAWHLQMAIDEGRGTPQKYRRRPAEGGAYLDFFSPIPLWAQRCLSIVGRAARPEHCLLSYWIPEREIAAEENFVKEHLWLKAIGSEQQKGRG